MTEGRKQNRNKSKSSSKDKEVNMTARDSDDALVCCVENAVEDHIMDSGASFHATYCKEELERFKIRSSKVRLADDNTLDIAGVGDVVLKNPFVGQLDEEGYHIGFRDQQWIGMSMLASKGKVPDVRKVDIYFCKPGGLGKQKNLSFIMSEKTRKLQRLEQTAAGVAVETPLQFGVAERLSRTFRAESTGIRVEAPKMLWADSVSTAYLIYRIPYVPIGLRIPEEEWRGKDTSLTHLKVFGCDSFVKVKDVCGEAMKCTFIGSGSDEMRYSFRDTKSHQVIRSRDITFVDSIYEARSASDSSSLTKPIQKSQVVLVDIPENLAENDSIVAEHGLSSEITQSPGGSSDTSEGSKNSGSFEDSGRSYEEDSEDGASSKRRLRDSTEALSSKESVQWKKAIIEEMVSLEKNQTCSLVRISSRKKASQRLWMFKVNEEQNSRKRYKARLVVKGFQQKRRLRKPSYVGALNDTSTQHKSEGFQLVVQEENLECRLKEILYGLIQAPRLRYLKFNSFMQMNKAPTWQSSTSLSDSWNEEPCRDVHQVGDEREVEVLRSFNWPPSELITEDGVLPERGYSQFNDVSSGYLVSKVS
ncbi:retrovirus-related pol polyprotein from transposon TNT 1-94 [Tanacetum coccineum]